MYVTIFSRSFAYLTIKDRIPQILTKAIDTLHRHKSEFFEKHGEVRNVFFVNSLTETVSSFPSVMMVVPPEDDERTLVHKMKLKKKEGRIDKAG